MPHGGVDAVGADEDIRLLDHLRSGLAIRKADLHTTAVLLKSGELQSASKIVVAHTVADGAEQQKL